LVGKSGRIREVTEFRFKIPNTGRAGNTLVVALIENYVPIGLNPPGFFVVNDPVRLESINPITHIDVA